MTDSLSLNTIQSEFGEESEAWVLQDTHPQKIRNDSAPQVPGP
jgi:hypothetical protein